MAFGVFIHRSDSIYDDSPAERYQFPPVYLERVRRCIGDWIVYYEPRKVFDTRGYFAVAQVEQVIPDPSTPGMHLALIAPGTYLDFAAPVAFTDEFGELAERGLLNEAGRISGRAQAAVRALSPEDFRRIVDQGLGDAGVLPRVDNGFKDEAAEFIFEQERIRATYVATRAVRDRVFRTAVLQAYDSRCALTGLKLINGRGRAEVEAAHIRPVEAKGPDIISNGIALSGTVHWMFDRGLISLADDLTILVSRQANDAESIRSIMYRDGKARVPPRRSNQPHPHFLEWHRSNCFKR